MSDYLAHNKSVLASLKIGDAVEFKRFKAFYSHWGIYIGNEQIIHLTCPRENAKSGSSHSSSGCSLCGLNFDKAIVQIDDFWDVVGEDCEAEKNNSKDNYLPVKAVDEIIKMAKSLIGETNYNLIYNNCEHFVSKCRNGIAKSEQVDTATKNVGFVAAAGTILIAAGALAAAAVVTLLGGKKEKNKNRMDF